MSSVPSIDQLAAEIPAGTPLEQLSAAQALADQLRARGDELLDQVVEAARSTGSSWTEIGCSLGTSKQAAQQRFAALADPASGDPPFGLTGPIAVTLSAAGEEARALGHHYIRPEHIVLGLLAQPEELAAQALTELGMTDTAVRAQITERLGGSPARPTGSLGIAPQTKRMLEQPRADLPQRLRFGTRAWQRRSAAARAEPLRIRAKRAFSPSGMNYRGASEAVSPTPQRRVAGTARTHCLTAHSPVARA